MILTSHQEVTPLSEKPCIVILIGQEELKPAANKLSLSPEMEKDIRLRNFFLLKQQTNFYSFVFKFVSGGPNVNFNIICIAADFVTKISK